jgi:RNA polymerase sigma-70 factor (ECF subfamily)
VSIDPDERSLVARVLGGDEAALDGFIDDYYPRLYRFAYPRVGRDAEAAQDVVQGTFATVVRKLASYRGEAALFSWMCAICRYEIAAHWRATYRRPPEVALAEELPDVRAALESFASSDPNPVAELERRELSRLVRVALDHLPLRYGKVLEWKYLQELPVADIAGRLGVSPKAAESLLTRARQAFRDGFGTLIGEST